MSLSTKFLVEQICSKYLDKKERDKCKHYYDVMARKLPLLKYNQCLVCIGNKEKGESSNDIYPLIADHISSLK